jgi:hypothetical protein
MDTQSKHKFYHEQSWHVAPKNSSSSNFIAKNHQSLDYSVPMAAGNRR